MISKIDRIVASFAALAALSLLFGCARSAPDLPVSRIGKSDAEVQKLLNINAADLAMECPALDAALAKVNEAIDDNELVIKGDRTKNQIVGYLGALFILPVIGTENNDEAKENLEKLQVRKDQLYYLKSRKACS